MAPDTRQQLGFDFPKLEKKAKTSIRGPRAQVQRGRSHGLFSEYVCELVTHFREALSNLCHKERASRRDGKLYIVLLEMCLQPLLLPA